MEVVNIEKQISIARKAIIAITIAFACNVFIDIVEIARMAYFFNTSSPYVNFSEGSAKFTYLGRRSGEELGLIAGKSEAQVFSCERPGFARIKTCFRSLPEMKDARTKISWMYMPSGVFGGEVRRPLEVTLGGQILYQRSLRQIIYDDLIGIATSIGLSLVLCMGLRFIFKRYISALISRR